MRLRFPGIITALAVLFGASARAAGPEIEYAYPDQSVWTAEVDGDGNPANPLLKFAAALFAEAGIPWHGTAYPASRMFNQLRSGQSQFSILVRAPTLAECCLISRKPVARSEIKVFWLGDVLPPIRRKEDLAGKNIIVVRGYSYGELAPFLADERNAIQRTTVDTHRAAFSMLEYGRGDYLLEYAGPAREMLAAKPIADIRSAVVADMAVHMVLNRSYPDAEAVMGRLEAIAGTLDKDRIMPGLDR